MQNIVSEILALEFNSKIDSVIEIANLGSVNKVYDVKSNGESIILRINQDANKEFEFWKEKWCLEKAASLDVASPKVLKIGIMRGLPYMILSKIEGRNGSICLSNEKLNIWENLGSFANKFHVVKQIEELPIKSDEFHANWSSKLSYNIAELSSKDSLLIKEVFRKDEQERIREVLIELQGKKFLLGLVHGDLCPRNTIFNDGKVFLLDWGSAKIDIVPHSEIGQVLMDNDLRDAEFKSFLDGLGISDEAYKKIEEEIIHINLLNRLDLYRWAEGSNFLIEEYIEKLKNAYEKIFEDKKSARKF